MKEKRKIKSKKRNKARFWVTVVIMVGWDDYMNGNMPSEEWENVIFIFSVQNYVHLLRHKQLSFENQYLWIRKITITLYLSDERKM